MSGDSYVAVDPANLQTLAARIHDLAAAVATEGATIRSLMQKWNDESSWTQLATIQNRFGDQAVSMKRRSDLAVEVANKRFPGFGTDPVVTGADKATSAVPAGMLVVPWDTSDKGYSDEAAQEAAALKKALDDGQGHTSLDEINRIGQVLADHQADPQFLAAFYQNGGADQVYRLPDVLRGWDDDKYLGKDGGLSPDGRQILKPFADNLAAASNQVQGLSLPGKAFDTSKPGDNSTEIPSWALSQLMAVGPAGGLWGADYLARVAAKAIPYGDNWYAIDKANDWSTQGPQSDIMKTVLQRLQENPAAALDMLAGKDGSTSAKLLFQDSAYFGPMGGAQIIQDALAHTLGPNTAGPVSLTVDDQAAVNVFNGVAGIDPKNMQQVSPDMLNALAAVAKPYTSDFAKSVDMKFTQDGLVSAAGAGGRIQLTSSTVDGVLAALAAGKDSTDSFTGSIAETTQKAVAAGTNLTAQDVQDLGALEARWLIAGQNGDIFKAEHQDKVNTSRQAWIGSVLGVVSAMPIPEEWFGRLNKIEPYAQEGESGAAAWLSAVYPTGNQQNQEGQAQTALRGSWGALDASIVQGLILNGTIKPGDVAGQSWCKDGVVDVTDANINDFTQWVHDNMTVDPKSQAPSALANLKDKVKLGMIGGGMTWGVE